MSPTILKPAVLSPCLLTLLLVPLSCAGQTFGERLKKAILGQPSSPQGQGDYIGGRRGYVEGSGSVSSMECYEMGGRDHQYPHGVRQAQREMARYPDNVFAPDELKNYTRACGQLPELYTQEEHQAWIEEREAERARARAAYEGSAMQRRDEALLRLLEPVAGGDAPGSHDCNQSEKQQYANAKEIVMGGYNSGYSKSELDGAHLTIELIENRCGVP